MRVIAKHLQRFNIPCWMVLVCCIFSFHQNSVFAMSIDDFNSTINARPWYGRGDGCVGQVEIDPSNYEGGVFAWLASESVGFSKEQSAGIVGNMIAESGVQPQRLQGSDSGSITTADAAENGSLGWGLVQWTPPSKMITPVKQVQQDPNDIVVQLEFLVGQLNNQWPEGWSGGPPASGFNEKTAGDDLKQQTTVDGAARSFMLKYERPRDKSERKQAERVRLAEGVYQNHANQMPTNDLGNTTCSPGDNIFGDFVYYSQHDPSWANETYKYGTISQSGCGPSSVAMVVATLVDRDVTPLTIAQEFRDYHIRGGGSSWALFTDAPRRYGLTSVDIGTSMSEAKAALRDGKLVIASGRGVAPFTRGGHILVLRGITESDKILIGDPNSEEESEKEHNPGDLSASIRGMWVISGASE